MWCIIVNRKLAQPAVYGPYESMLEASKVEDHLSKLPYVKTVYLMSMTMARVEDNSQLVTEAWL